MGLSGLEVPAVSTREVETLTTPSKPILPLCICGDPSCRIPYGFCHCECGKLTRIADKNCSKRGDVKGFPRRFRVGHGSRTVCRPEYAVPFKLDGVYCRVIPLGDGLVAIVNEDDYYVLAFFKWSYFKSPHTGTFYAHRGIKLSDRRNSTYSMHRQVMGFKRGDPRQVDHKDNLDTLNNTRNNLRDATHDQNMHNRGMLATNKSGYKGVSWKENNNSYVAQISFQGKRIHLGYRKTARAAHEELYVPAALKYHRKFARVA